MKWKISVSVVLATIMLAFLFLLPDVQMPKPNGDHLVGATQFEIQGEKTGFR